jgi:universal stress protein E
VRKHYRNTAYARVSREVDTARQQVREHHVIENILVVVDPTATSHLCIEKAARLAQGFGSTLELFIGDVEQGGGTAFLDYRKRLRKQRLAVLEALAVPLRERGLHVKTESQWHVPLEQGIVEHAIRNRVDLVVKDTHRHRPESHMPSVQTDWVLIRQLPMALLLVRATPWSAHPLLVAAVDPCHEADRPPELDRSLQRLGNTVSDALVGNVALLHVLEPVPHLPDEVISVQEHAAARERKRQEVVKFLNDGPVAPRETRFIEGTVPEGIVQAVQSMRPAMLLMGVAARQRLHTGAVSTASQVLEQTDCDLLVVKPAGFVSPALVTR